MTFRAWKEDFEAAHSFVAGMLDRRDVNEQVARETLIVFEALFQKLLDSDLPEDTQLDVSWVKKLGGFSVRIGFEGSHFDLHADGARSIEGRIIRSYDDKLDCSYRAGYNLISISVSRSYRRRLFACAIAALLAVVAYIPLHFLVDEAGRYELLEGYVLPIETAYANIALMVGAPMTFFSLLKNLTDTYVVSQRNSKLRKLQAKTIVTSIIAILIAIAASLLWSIPLADFAGKEAEYAGSGFDHSFSSVVTSSAPSNIFEPFVGASPLPAVIIVVLCAFAMRSTVKYFDMLKTGFDAIYSLLCSMLRIIMTALPLFSFITFLAILINGGLELLLAFVAFFVLVVISWTSLVLTYAIRLRISGIPVIAFAKKLPPLIIENLKIGSAIDAVPFNVRYCAKHYGMNRSRIKNSLQITAQLNLDGNCYLIMVVSLLLITFSNIDLTWIDITGIGVLVFFLSLGAPNQPGSILIGVLIMLQFANAFDMLGMAIAAEVFLGGMQNITNVIGDIVLAAIDDRAYERSHQQHSDAASA